MTRTIENESERALVEWLGHQGWDVAVSDGPSPVAAVAHATRDSGPVVVTASGFSQHEAVRRLLSEVARRSLLSLGR